MKAGIMIAAALLMANPVKASSKDEPVLGPAPTWEEFRRLGEAEIKSRLIDPDSAKISWIGGYYNGGFKPFLEPRVHGYAACGAVNAKNRMGGYTGSTSFVVVIDRGHVAYAQIEAQPGGILYAQCAQALKAGNFPPLSEQDAGLAPPTAATPSTTLSGLTLRVMPEGAYVTAVEPGSPAAIAGLRPGMVIGSVNAIPLAGMGDAMVKAIDAAGATATLTVVGGQSIKLLPKK